MNRKSLVTRLIEIGAAAGLITALLLYGSAEDGYPAEEVCQYVWHDHYKTNYRLRHKHKVCGSVAAHYQDDPFRTMQLYYPDLYLREALENRGDTATTKFEESLQSEQ